MTNLSSARLREETPHLSDALKRRAQSVINEKSIDARDRAIIRYGLETNDPWLAELVRRVDAGETIADNLRVPQRVFAVLPVEGRVAQAVEEFPGAIKVQRIYDG